MRFRVGLGRVALVSLLGLGGPIRGTGGRRALREMLPLYVSPGREDTETLTGDQLIL